jgi:Kelch motif
MKQAALVTLLVGGFAAKLAALGAWSVTGSMAVARTQHAAVRLADGRVLATGGVTATATTGTAEVFDPAAGTWSLTGSLITPRSRHTATLLADGRVLVTGGRFRGASLASAEIYDADAGMWLAVAAMHAARDNHAATLLADGRVLVTGGVSGGDGGSPVEKSAEIFDPATDTWTAADHMSIARYNQQATLLADGRVLVTGGFNVSIFHIPIRDAEIYDPAADRWSQARNMDTPRATHVAFLRADGRVAVAGGWTQPPNTITITATAETYDPVANAWTPAPGLPAPRGSLVNHGVMLLNGDFLAAGGRLDSGTIATSDRYSAATGTWSVTGSMSVPRVGATAVLLADGRVLIAGGGNAAGVLSSAEIYQP